MRRMGKIAFIIIFLVTAAVICVTAIFQMQASKQQPLPIKTLPAAKIVTEEIKILSTSLAFEEQRYISAALSAGQEEIVKQGKQGIAEQTVKITYENGKEISRAFLSEKLVQTPSEQIVLYGVDRTASVQTHPGEPIAKDGILTTPDGELLTYTKVLSCSATAYSCEGYVGTTAIGTTARVGAVAVDPNYIPYGTKMYIVSNDGAYIYGIAVAEDCGNFRGYHVDLYFNTVDECWTFGRRSCTVYILA